jgi:hypothetical protein
MPLAEKAALRKTIDGVELGESMQAEDIFRSANERIAEKARELGWRSRIPFLCECSERLCFQRLELTIEEYDATRSHPQRYVVARGHEVTGALLLEQDDRAAYVEKLSSGTRPQ